MKNLIDRKDMAQALNFGKYPVLTYNVDTDKGSHAVCEVPYKGSVIRYRTTLYRGKKTKDDGIFYLLTHATVMSATLHVTDWIKSAEYANAPVIAANQEVAILLYSEDLDTAVVKIVKSGKVDPSFATATTFAEID